MSDHPILFSGSMVRAILDDSKTQTRRVVKPQPEYRGFCGPALDGRPALYWSSPRYDNGCGVHYFHTDEEHGQRLMETACPYGQPGDRLWVKETWYCDDIRVQSGPFVRPDDWDEETQKRMMYFRATDCAPGGETFTGFSGETMRNPWQPSLFMPRWASRVTLEIMEVRVDRLQEISEPDAQAEGAVQWWLESDRERLPDSTARAAFRQLWDSINGKRGFGWDVNPWVWVIQFRRV